MRICALFGGQHKKGNTATALEQVLAGARFAKHTTVRIDLADLNIGHCKGCLACKKKNSNGCIQKDDMAKVLEEIQSADLLIFATPMYWWNVAAPLKIAIDRMFALPFNVKNGETGFAGKKLLLVMTSGQPAESDGREGLELVLKKMCDFTGMTWLGTITTGTNAIPVRDQENFCKSAYAFGASL